MAIVHNVIKADTDWFVCFPGIGENDEVDELLLSPIIAWQTVGYFLDEDENHIEKDRETTGSHCYPVCLEQLSYNDPYVIKTPHGAFYSSGGYQFREERDVIKYFIKKEKEENERRDRRQQQRAKENKTVGF